MITDTEIKSKGFQMLAQNLGDVGQRSLLPSSSGVVVDKTAKHLQDWVYNLSEALSMADKLTVNAFWDNDAGVWVATSDDVIGLVAESPDMGQLVKDLQDIIPTLLEENHQAVTTSPIELLYSGKESLSLVL